MNSNNDIEQKTLLAECILESNRATGELLYFKRNSYFGLVSPHIQTTVQPTTFMVRRIFRTMRVQGEARSRPSALGTALQAKARSGHSARPQH
jgi:hypothetical protein